MPSSQASIFATKSTQLLWNLITTIPPLISCTPSSAYFREWHEKELSPTWNNDLINYELVYYRPILFTSCDGKVARKGFVGNKERFKNPSIANHSTIENGSKLEKSNSDVSSLVHPSLCEMKHPCSIPYSRLTSDNDKSLPKDQPEETMSKFYPQNIDVDVSRLSTKNQRQKSGQNWSTQRHLM